MISSSKPGEQPTMVFAYAGHEAAAQFLRNVQKTRRLGSRHAESDVVHNNIVKTFILTFPWLTMIVQTLWTCAVLGASWALSRRRLGRGDFDLLDNSNWESRINVSPSVASGVGWALFVLLGFFLNEASGRYVSAQFAINAAHNRLRHLVAIIRQSYPSGTWHHGDLQRMLAHLVAYPIALKMTLRGESDPQQLSPILHSLDAADVAKADAPHIHCLRVVRAYTTAAEDDVNSFALTPGARSTPAGSATRVTLPESIDTINSLAQTAVLISKFRSSIAYVNHLRIFLYIWLMFLPLTLVQSSGLFTLLWSLLITYGVSMIFYHARAMSEPFGFDIQDVKLNQICAGMALDVLYDSFASPMEATDLIREPKITPAWLADDGNASNDPPTGIKHELQISTRRHRSLIPRFRGQVLLWLSVLLIWTALVVFLTWRYRDRDDQHTSRNWWNINIPLSDDTTTYISLCVFILLGFWVNDAYGRYSRALQIWQTDIKPQLIHFAFEFSVGCRRGALHENDRERLLSFLVALPFASMLHLRNDRNVDILADILAPEDLHALARAPNLQMHVLNVIRGYVHAVDIKTMPGFADVLSNFGFTLASIQIEMWSLVQSLADCDSIQKFPISPTFTMHLQLFSGFWLALLPFTLVRYHGFVSFLYVLVIGFSIINLLCVGQELADPFGKDADDLPLEAFCSEVKAAVREIYGHTVSSTRYYVYPAPYSRESLAPKRRTDAVLWPTQHVKKVGFLSLLQSGLQLLPSVPAVPLLLAILWNIAAVFISWGLSRISIWGDRRSECVEWCSPIDVNPSVLGNVGFALFMILAFRASDAINRYDKGAFALTRLHRLLRSLTMVMIQSFKANSFHMNDKERIVAHMAQIPLCIRDVLLGNWPSPTSEQSGLLTHEDRLRLEASPNPVYHLINTVESYLSGHDLPNPKDSPDPEHADNLTCLAIPTHLFFSNLRSLFETVMGIKRFPVIRSYRRHQYVFAGVWLILLPLSMTPQTGFFTILWSSLIAYGVLGMEEIATRLVDPYGTDAVDLPVSEMCEKASASILNAVNSADWDCHQDVQCSKIDKAAGLGTVVKDDQVSYEYTIASSKLELLNDHATTVEKGSKSVDMEAPSHLAFRGPRETRTKPTLLAHILRSVPWWALLVVTVWTVLACIISYLTRSREKLEENLEKVRWWESFISISGFVAIYVSIAAFALLSFYVSAAYGRYSTAGQVWGDLLRGSCHGLASTILSLWPCNAVHDEDHRRVIGHIAAIPLVLKAELRHSRDIREIMGLVSSSDLAQIQCAESMSLRCVDVVRAYVYKVQCQTKTIGNPKVSPGKAQLLGPSDLMSVEYTIHSAIHLNTFDIAPGFLALLNGLLGIWFIILPFVLAETSGWFTILWVPIISYGLLGMYNLAAELQHPFGSDLNDLDLDRMADEIVSDILDVWRTQPEGFFSLVKECPNSPLPIWHDESTTILTLKTTAMLATKNIETQFGRFKQGLRLAFRPVSPIVFALVVIWSAIAAVITYYVRKHFWEGKRSELCSPYWDFCSPIAVDGNVKEYAGFALFLLLAFRLSDSHSRFVEGLEIWQQKLTGITRLTSGRIFQGLGDESWHQGDTERIAGHMVGYALCLKAALRGEEDCQEELSKILGPSDVQRIMSAVNKASYCNDVVRSYILQEDWRSLSGRPYVCPSNDITQLAFYAQRVAGVGSGCRALARTLMPFGYVQHLRIFLIIWIVLLPFGLVESSGWLAILWVAIIAYGIIGIERWAEELSDPYGEDISDVPLETLCNLLFKGIKYDINLYKHGMAPFINDRPPFSSAPQITTKETAPVELATSS